MPDIMKMKPKESDGVDSVIIVDGVPVVGTDRYTTSLVDPWHFSTDPDPHLLTDPESDPDPDFSWTLVIIVDGVPVVGTDRYHQRCGSVTFWRGSGSSAPYHWHTVGFGIGSGSFRRLYVSANMPHWDVFSKSQVLILDWLIGTVPCLSELQFAKQSGISFGPVFMNFQSFCLGISLNNFCIDKELQVNRYRSEFGAVLMPL